MRCLKFLTGAILVLVCVAVVVYIYRPQPAALPSQPLPVPVYTAMVVSGSSSGTISLIGLLRAVRSVEVSAQLSGVVRQVFFKEGDRVSAGETLVKLDDSLYQAQLSSATAKYNAYDKHYQRLVFLEKKGDVSKKARDEAYIQLKTYQSAADELKTDIAHTLIKAPFTGRTGLSNVTTGSYLSAGDAVVQLVDTTKLLATYNVPGEFYPQLKTGQTVTITSDAYPDKTFTGATSFISPVIDISTNTITVQALIDNPQSLLTAGMYVQVVQQTGKPVPVVTVPVIALVPVIDGEEVYVAGRDGRARAVRVTTGSVTGDRIVVLSGLKAGMQVITQGQEKLKDGDLIRVITPRQEHNT